MMISSRSRLLVGVLIIAMLHTYVTDAAEPLDVEWGKRVSLKDLGGPNVDLIVNSVSSFDITVTTLDYDRIHGWVGYNNWSAKPEGTRRQIKKGDKVTLLYRQGKAAVYYVDDPNTAMNHAKLVFVAE